MEHNEFLLKTYITIINSTNEIQGNQFGVTLIDFSINKEASWVTTTNKYKKPIKGQTAEYGGSPLEYLAQSKKMDKDILGFMSFSIIEFGTFNLNFCQNLQLAKSTLTRKTKPYKNNILQIDKNDHIINLKYYVEINVSMKSHQ